MKYEASQAALRACDDKERMAASGGLSSHRFRQPAPKTSERFEGAPALTWITRPAFSHLDRPQAPWVLALLDGLPKLREHPRRAISRVRVSRFNDLGQDFAR